MFQSARIKLTAWYLLIIMSVSLAFSGVIYRMLSQEVGRFARMQIFRIENRFGFDTPSDLPHYAIPPSAFIDESLITEIKQRILVSLGIINLGVFGAAGALGYFLAGRTLKPIRDMVDEQHRFISDASHELRTPLTAIKSAMEVNLRDPKLTIAEAKALMKDSIEDVNKLQTLSDALLTLAQYEKPSAQSAFRRLDVAQIVRDAIRKTSALARRKRIRVTETIKTASVRGNADALTELLVILLDNAIKYSPERSAIGVSAVHADGAVVLTVSDTGPGIAKADLPHIFDRFYRADTARSKSGTGGYGLGLSIAKKIADMHKGSIECDSTPGKGSTFTVRLPSHGKNGAV